MPNYKGLEKNRIHRTLSTLSRLLASAQSHIVLWNLGIWSKKLLDRYESLVEIDHYGK